MGKTFVPRLCTLQSSVWLLNKVSKEIVSNNTSWRRHVWSSHQTLESIGEMKPIMKFYLHCEFYFLAFPYLFDGYLRKYYILSFSKMQNTINIKLFWYNVFVHLNLKLPHFLSDFVSNFKRVLSPLLPRR